MGANTSGPTLTIQGAQNLTGRLFNLAARSGLLSRSRKRRSLTHQIVSSLSYGRLLARLHLFALAWINISRHVEQAPKNGAALTQRTLERERRLGTGLLAIAPQGCDLIAQLHHP